MNWKQRLGVAWMFLLVAVAICVAVVVPARTFGGRLLHAFFAVIALGVVAVAVLFVAFFVAGIRESRIAHRSKAP
jgi:hypothetical protein